MPTATKKPKTPSKPRETQRHREAFEAWYAADRSVCNILETIRVPQSTLFYWMDTFNWHELADARDAEANKIADAKAIKDRAKRLEDQRKAGTLLRVRGMQAIGAENFQFDTSGDMIRAIKTGVDIERDADGYGKKVELTGKDGAAIQVEAVNRLSDDELNRKISELLVKAGKGIPVPIEAGTTETGK